MLWMLLAETGGADTQSWVALVTSISSTGFAVWYAWYMTTKRIPEIERTHDANQALLLANFRDDIKFIWTEKGKSDDKMLRVAEMIGEKVDKIPCRYAAMGTQHIPVLGK